GQAPMFARQAPCMVGGIGSAHRRARSQRSQEHEAKHLDSLGGVQAARSSGLIGAALKAPNSAPFRARPNKAGGLVRAGMNEALSAASSKAAMVCTAPFMVGDDRWCCRRLA